MATTPALPSLPFDYATWKKDTYIAVSLTDPTGRAKFGVLDKAVEAYTKTPSQATLKALHAALIDWTSYKDKSGGAGAWKKSERNKKLSITALFAALEGHGDTDTGMGMPDFMGEGMLNARLGVLYLFGNLACDEGKYRIVTHGLLDLKGKGNGSIGTAVKRTAEAAACLMPFPAGSAERQASRHSVSTALQGMAASIAQAVFTQAANGEDDGEPTKAEAIWEAIPGGLRTVCDHIAERVMDEISPFLANGVAVTKGLATAIRHGCERYVVHAKGKRVALLPGVPTTTIDGIKRGMDIALASDGYHVLKGGASLALEGLTAGIAGIVADVAFSAVEALVAFVKKVHDFYRMRIFLGEARALWLQRDKPTSLHRQPYAFNRWYRRTAMRVPAVPVLALNSGLCGDKMRMLCMFANEGEVITQKAFDDGVAYIDRIKGWGATYLAECGYAFSSKDPLVAASLAPVKV
ncbi:hypothetical protein [Luteibacter yeojuensis]|uniref:Uncharacterized protein n=1 Tax=Luteibacter yeojuensis TaxID=345309 RepID=A0A0F3KI96_9GAMM|nr:hypothetical protein [Luteibacter yeojuensis]KJV30938.1 hypothetical protein VI08_14430 [Luteibacter yeojuensis]